MGLGEYVRSNMIGSLQDSIPHVTKDKWMWAKVLLDPGLQSVSTLFPSKITKSIDGMQTFLCRTSMLFWVFFRCLPINAFSPELFCVQRSYFVYSVDHGLELQL